MSVGTPGGSELMHETLNQSSAPGETNEYPYRPLAADFRSDGFSHQLIKREKDVAIYRKFKVVDKYLIESYEVIIVRNREEYTIAGKTIPAAEIYPNNEAWGTFGFTYSDYQEAYRKFCNLKAKAGARQK